MLRKLLHQCPTNPLQTYEVSRNRCVKIFEYQSPFLPQKHHSKLIGLMKFASEISLGLTGTTWSKLHLPKNNSSDDIDVYNNDYTAVLLFLS